MVYDPWGGLQRGILAGVGLADIFARRGLRERALGLEETREKRLQQLFDLQMEQKLREEGELEALPGAGAALFRAARPEVTEPDLLSGMAEGVGIADIASATRGARTVPELMGRGLSPEHLALLARRAPGIFPLAGVRPTHAVEAEDRTQADRQKAQALVREAWGDFQAGRRGEGGLKLYEAGQLSGRAMPAKDVLDLIEDEQSEEEVAEIAGLWEQAVGGDREAVGKVLGKALRAKTKGGRALAGPTLGFATKLLGDPDSDKVEAGYRAFHELARKHGDDLKAWKELERTQPGLVRSMEKAKAIPAGVEIALRQATQRAGGEAVKTLEGEALEISRRIAAREFPNDPEKRAALTTSIASLMSLGRTSSLRSAADLHRRIQEAIAELKGIGAPPPPSVKDAEAIQGLWDRFIGTTPAARTSPGRAGASANPPPASPTKRDALAEAQRLMGLGLSEEETVAAMRRAGWGGRGGPEAFIGP